MSERYLFIAALLVLALLCVCGLALILTGPPAVQVLGALLVAFIAGIVTRAWVERNR